MFAIVENSTPREITEQTVVLPDRKIPRANLPVWSAAERVAVNIYPIEVDVVPEGQRVTSSSLQFDGTRVRRVHQLYTPTAGELAAEANDRQERYLDAFDRLQFELHFDIENRVRVLEGKAAITRVQYRNALKTRLQALG